MTKVSTNSSLNIAFLTTHFAFTLTERSFQFLVMYKSAPVSVLSYQKCLYTVINFLSTNQSQKLEKSLD